MIKMKVGGMILTGCAAFMMANKVMNTVDSLVKRTCEAAKWRGYYRCWSKGQATGEPVAPGYSVTTRPDGADFEIVKDPDGKDHAHDNDISQDTDKVNNTVDKVIDAVKAVAEKTIDTLKKGPEAPEGALEEQIEVSMGVKQGTDVEDAIEEAFEVKETDDETVD